MNLRPQGVSSGITDQLYSGRRERKPDDPVDIPDGERQRTELLEEIRKVQLWLSSKNKTDENGKRINNKYYHACRAQVLEKKSRLESRLMYLKQWLKDERKSRIGNGESIVSQINQRLAIIKKATNEIQDILAIRNGEF